MKKLCLLSIVFFIVCAVNAQTESSVPAQMMLLMWENEVPPSLVQDYEEVVIKQRSILEKHNFPRSYYVYQTEDFHYWWLTEIEDFSDVQKQNQEFGAFASLMEEEEGFVFGEEFKSKTNYMKPMIFRWLPNLSYIPEGNIKLDQRKYFRWGYCYVKVGFEAKLQQTWAEYVNLFSENQVEIGWNLYSGIVGTENPFYMWGEIYDSPLDMETKRANAFKKIAEESDELWNEVMQCLRKFELKTGWYRPDLSYIFGND